MMWCVLFVYIDTHKLVDVPSINNLSRETAQFMANQPRSGIYGVARPQVGNDCKEQREMREDNFEGQDSMNDKERVELMKRFQGCRPDQARHSL